MFRNKTVLITGHTGFKGSWLSVWLSSLGARVVGLSLDVPSSPSNFDASSIENVVEDYRADVRDKDAVATLVESVQPDFVFHLAAQALVRPSYAEPIETLTTNAIGTANVLDALRRLKKTVVAVMITSDKAYDNVEWVWGYRETDRIGGRDPYSASKGMAELVIRTYVDSFFSNDKSDVRVGIARAGNVIGGGDWATDRIVVDCMRAWSEKKVVEIRSPSATRPWQHVLEPLSGYLSLACSLSESTALHGQAFNFGPPAVQDYSVQDLIEGMSQHWENVRWLDTSITKEHVHEAGLLKLNCDKALHFLNWNPTLVFDETVEMTVDWYKKFYEDQDSSMLDFTTSQIREYTELGRTRGCRWADND